MKKIFTLPFALLLSLASFGQQGGYALQFEADKEVNVADHSSISFDGTAATFTIEGWIKPTGGVGTAGWSGLVSKSVHTSTKKGYSIELKTDYTVAFVYGNSDSDWDQIISADAIPLHVWTHFCAVFDGTNGTKLYINGKLSTSKAWTNGITDSNTGLTLGNNPTDKTQDYYGFLDEVRIWNVARTEAEIKANMFKEIGTHTNLKAYYKMTDGSGTTVTDNSGNENAGTLTAGLLWKASGCFAGSRQALDFDGTASTGGEYVGITNGAALIANQNNITIELWVYPIKTGPWSSWTTDYEGLFNFGTSNDFYFVRWDNNVELRYNSTTYNVNTVRSPIEINKWQHLAFVKNGSSLKLYRNGILENESTLSGGNYTNTTNLMTIGKSFYSSYHWPFKGSIDEFRIWTTARSEAQIRETMFKTLEGNEPGLNTYFRFDQVDGTSIVYDMSSNAHNGTLTNIETTDWVSSTAFNTWLGGESNAWSTAANWSNGVPTSTQSAGIYNWSSSLPLVTNNLPVLPATVSVNNLLIPSGVTASGNVNLTATGSAFLGSSLNLSSSALNTAGNIEIESGKTLTLPASAQLTVSGTTANDAGNTGLVLENGASLLHNSSGVAATVKREITGQALSDAGATKYHFVAIPTQYASPTSNLFFGSYLYKLDPVQTFATNNYGNWVALGASTTTELLTNQGYMVYYPNPSVTYTFEGNLNNGTYAYSLTGHTGAEVYTFNLLPNPYPSSIVWNTGDATKWTKSSGVGGSCYIWNAENGNYTTVASGASSYIPVGQAFMVMVTNEAAPALSVLNAARTHSTQSFYKAETHNEFQVIAQSNGYADQSVIAFNDEATTGFDLATDGLKLDGLEEAPQLWTMGETTRMSVNNLPLFTDRAEVDLFFKTTYAGQVTLSFSNLDSFDPALAITLVDNLTGSTVNLRNSQSYTFQHNTEFPANRFKVLFGSAIGTPETANATIRQWNSGQTLYISAPTLAGQQVQVTVYSLTGQALQRQQVTLGEINAIALQGKQGALVVETKSEDGSRVLTTKGMIIK